MTASSYSRTEGINLTRRFRDVTTRRAQHQTPSRTLRNLFRSAGLCGARERRHRSGPGRQGRRWTGKDAEGRPGSAQLPEGTGLGLAKRVNKTARCWVNHTDTRPLHTFFSRVKLQRYSELIHAMVGCLSGITVRPQMCALKAA